MNRVAARRLLLVVAATVGAFAGAPVAGTAGAAASTVPVQTAAAGPTNLGIANFGRILVDPVTSHVFVSSPGSNAVVVLDFNGTIVKTIAGEAGAKGMAVRGSTLYVALSSGGAIDKIDTGTLAETGLLVSGLVQPTDIVLAGSKLWTTTGNCASWSVQLAGIDPAAPTPAVVLYPNAFNTTNQLSYCAAFASNPNSNPNVFLAWALGLSSGMMTSFDVSSGSPVQQVSVGSSQLANLQDIAINPDGTHFVTASGAPYEFDEWNLSSLAQDGTVYPATPFPTAVATTSGNGGVIGGGLNGLNGPDFYAYEVGHTAVPMSKVDFLINTVPPRGVAFSPDGRSAFVVADNGNPTPAPEILNVVPVPLAGLPSPPTAVTATGGIGAATVSWAPPLDPGDSPVSSYSVTSSPGGVTVTVPATQTSTVVNGLSPGPAYTFTVTATNAKGTGRPSTPSNVVVSWACSPPTNVSATPMDSAVFVDWQAPAAAAAVITGYRVTPYLGTTAQPPTAVSGTPAPANAIVSGLTNGATYTFVVACTINGAPGQDSAPSNAVMSIQGGNYHPLTPARILDTRNAIGGPTQALHNAEIRPVQITGQGNVPSTGVSAVVLNVTVTGSNSAGYLTVYPSGVSRPTASNLNFVAGQTVPNLVEVAVGLGGKVDVFTQFASTAGQADVLFDVAGWVGVARNSLVKDGLYNPLSPARIMDTRSGIGAPTAAVGPGQTVTLNVFAPGGVPSGAGVSAVVLNVTVTGPSAASYLTVFPADAPQRPTASNLNFVAGQTIPNRVMVKVGAGGLVSFYNAAGSVQVIADIGGWFTDATSTIGGARFTGVIPTRMLDTRDPTIGPMIGGDTNTFQLLDQNTMQPVTDVSAVVFNVTVTNPTAASYVTLWPDGPPRPTVSDLNVTAGQTVPNMVVVKLGTNATIDVYNALGRADLIMDLVGFYGTGVAAPAGATGGYSLRLAPLRQRPGSYK